MKERKPIAALSGLKPQNRFIGIKRPAPFKRPTRKVKAFNKLLQDATGTEIDFIELHDGDGVSVGALAEVGGKKAVGEYLLPNGVTFVFKDGKLSKIVPAPKEQDAFAKKKIIAKPIDRSAGAKAYLNSKRNKSNPTATPENRFAGILERLKNRKK